MLCASGATRRSRWPRTLITLPEGLLMPDPWTRRGSTWIRESKSSALLTPQPPTSFLSDFDFSVNPYAGCPFACADCYVPALPSVKFRRELLPDGHPLKAAG